MPAFSAIASLLLSVHWQNWGPNSRIREVEVEVEVVLEGAQK